MRGAIILAGGEGRRFRLAGGVGDKALFKVKGKSMLKWVADAVSEVVDEWVVAVDCEDRAKRIQGEVDGRVVVDEGPRGPLTGMKTGMKALSSNACLVLTCDQPFVNPRVLDRLLRSVEEGWDAVLPIWPSGLHEPLTAAYSRKPALALCEALLAYGRARPDDLARAGLNTYFLSVAELKTLDQGLLTFLNVNRPMDVEAVLERKVSVEGGFSVEVWQGFDPFKLAEAAVQALNLLSPEPLQRFNCAFWHGTAWMAIAEERGKGWGRAAKWFKREARVHGLRGLELLRARALIDASRSLHHVDPKGARRAMEKAVKIYRRLGIKDKRDGF